MTDRYMPKVGERVVTFIGGGTVRYGESTADALSLGLVVPVAVDGRESETLWFSPRELRPESSFPSSHEVPR